MGTHPIFESDFDCLTDYHFKMSLREAQEAGLREHNRLRALHQDTEPLELSNDLCNDAQAWADQLMSQGRSYHAETNDGENIASAFQSGGRSPTVVEEAVGATQRWYNELHNYDFNNPGSSGNTGHFTQVVWKETRQLGLGIAQQGGKCIVVGRCRPAGNMTNPGYFRRNVAPLNGSGSSLPESATNDRPSRDVSENMNMGGYGMDMGGFMGNMNTGFPEGGRSVSTETTYINGRTIEKTTVVENGVTTVTTREF